MVLNSNHLNKGIRMSDKKLLTNIDKVEWSKLTHAYGEASDVPKVIRGLLSNDSESREKALWELYGNIFHQGTRYQATAPAVPFLYELALAPQVKDRSNIIYLLINLALGYEEAFLPTGPDMKLFRKSREEAAKSMSKEDKEACAEYGYGPQVELDCYDAVKDGVPKLITLLDDEDTSVQKAAAYALAWFPEEAEKSLPALQKHLKKTKTKEDTANALLAYGLLARGSGKKIDDETTKFHLSDDSLLVRTAAAIALYSVPLTSDILEILINAVQNTDALQNLEELHFNEGNIAGYASCVLTGADDSAHDKVIPALCKTLEAVNCFQSLDITGSILQLVVAGKDKYIKDMSLDSLTELEISALQAIAKHGGWKIDGATFVNYSDLVGSYGLPDSQEKLTAFLDGKPIE